MAFRRRHEPPQVVQLPPEPPAVKYELCSFCEGEISIDGPYGNGHVIALLLDVPGQSPYAFAHRHCAERARGWVRI